MPQHLLGELAFEEATEALEKVKQVFAICSLWEQENPAVTIELVGVERNRGPALPRGVPLQSAGTARSGSGHHTRSVLRGRSTTSTCRM